MQSALLHNLRPVSVLIETPTIKFRACNLVIPENNKVLEVENQLQCPDVQDAAGIDYNELKISFKFFQ